MIKHISIFGLCLFTLFIFIGMSMATPYTNTKDWNEEQINGRQAILITEYNGFPIFSYTHNVVFNPPAARVDSAILTLSHYGNAANFLEMWFLTTTDNSSYLGDLYNSSCNWVDQSFSLPASLYQGISGNSWSIGFKLKEGTFDIFSSDKLAIDKSVLSGVYSTQEEINTQGGGVVPEPGTLILLGVGLAGLVGYARVRIPRRKK